MFNVFYVGLYLLKVENSSHFCVIGEGVSEKLKTYKLDIAMAKKSFYIFSTHHESMTELYECIKALLGSSNVMVVRVMRQCILAV